MTDELDDFDPFDGVGEGKWLDISNHGAQMTAIHLLKIIKEGRDGGCFAGAEIEEAAQGIMALRSEVQRLKDQVIEQDEAIEALEGQLSGYGIENSSLRTRLLKIERVLSIATNGSREQLEAAIEDFRMWERLKEKRLKEGIDSPP